MLELGVPINTPRAPQLSRQRGSVSTASQPRLELVSNFLISRVLPSVKVMELNRLLPRLGEQSPGSPLLLRMANVLLLRWTRR